MMAYPDKINALVDVTADQTLAAGGHAARHNDVNEALDELEAVFTAPAANELALRPDGSTEAVRIDSSGNVGIGTTSPAAVLDVDGQVISAAAPQLSGGSSNQDLIVIFAEVGTATVWKGTLSTSSTSTANDIDRVFTVIDIIFRTSSNVANNPLTSIVARNTSIIPLSNDFLDVVKVTYDGTDYWGLIIADLGSFQSPGTPVFNGYASSLADFSFGYRGAFSAVTSVTPFAGRSSVSFPHSVVMIGKGDEGSAGAGDLVVNGGVFLGGNAAGNELDDYEEGTWTPTVTPGSGSFTTITIADAHYTRIGRVVTAFAEWQVTSVGTGSGSMNVTLPFTVDAEIDRMSATGRHVNTGVFIQGRCSPTGDAIEGIVYADSSSAIVDGNLYVITTTYFTDA